MNLIDLAETGRIPDWLVRKGIQRLLRQRLTQLENGDVEAGGELQADYVAELRDSPLAVHTDSANSQHYEVPARFFQIVLGPHLKYSCGWFDSPNANLAEAEAAMLSRTCQRADLADGQRILELGCGWGSLSLWMAEHYPNAQVTSISNSNSQRAFIESCAEQRGLHNLQVVTCDMRHFETDQKFDRVVSVEMFEHMRNYQLLLQRVSDWLTPEGMLFVHIFCHRQHAYAFETEGAANWMGRHFFTGGQMPSDNLLLHFQDDLALQRQWRVSGLHYWRTSEAWLQNLDIHRGEIEELFADDLGKQQAKIQVQRWRMFFLACAELFRYRGGNEWYVSHYLMQNRPSAVSAETAPQAVGV